MAIGKQGFTLIELTIVVAIISILASIAIPQFGNAIAKAHDATSKGNLGSIRSALSVYYADTEGSYVYDDLSSLTFDSKYLRAIPKLKIPTHVPTSYVFAHSPLWIVSTKDEGTWGYSNQMSSVDWGEVNVNCTHIDMKGVRWTTY